MVEMAVEMAGARQAVFEAAMEAATVMEIAVEMAGVARAAAAAPDVSVVARVEATVVSTDVVMEAAETVGVAMEAA